MLFEVLAVVPVLVLLWLVLSNDPPRLLGVYSQPGRFYYGKWLLMRLLLWRRQRQKGSGSGHEKGSRSGHEKGSDSGCKKRPGSGHKKGYGLKSHSSPEQMEAPQQLGPDPMAIDGMYFNGMNKDGTYFVMRIARRHHRIAELWLSIYIPDIGFFQSTVHPDTTVYNTDATGFNAAGLRFECVEPMKKWRIIYNGLLREGLVNDYSNREPKTRHVAFSFMWDAFTDEFDFDTDINPCLLAGAIAREPWSKQFWDTLQKKHQTHYEQWGELRGVVKVQGHEDIKMRLRGCRDHSYGVRDWRMFHRYIVIFAYLENGITFHVNTVSWTEGLSYLQCGYLSFPNATQLPVSWTDLDLPDTGEGGNPPDKFSFTFAAGGMLFVVDIKCSLCPLYHHHEDWGNVIHEQLCTLSVNGTEGYCVAEFCYRRSPSTSPVPQSESYPLLTEPSTIPPEDSTTYILPFTTPSCCCASLVGGKGCQLALLTQLHSKDFVVPPGFCLTLSAFEVQLKHSKEIMTHIDTLLGVACGRKEGDLHQTCSTVSACVSDQQLCGELKDALVTQLVTQFGDKWPEKRFAVRSSAAGEDSVEMSAAGQMDTILGVKGQKQIFEAICKCWASQFAVIAVEYRRQHGQPMKGGMGVVIQEMVPAQSAGVLFTRDPLSGSPGQMVLNANYGLGESVVSGEAEPDTVTINRTWDDILSVEDKQIGKKNVQIHLAASGGIETVENTGNGAEHCSISDDVILRLAAIGVELEKRFSDARDIEWAVQGDTIYLLQARPITTLDQESDEDLMHEFDSPLTLDREVVTTCNIGEMMPSAMTPLTLSVFMGGIEIAGQAFEMNGGVIPRVHDFYKFSGTCANHALINLHFLEGLHGNNIMGNDKRMAELSLMGELMPDLTQDEVEEYNGKAAIWKRIYNAIINYRNLTNGYNRLKGWTRVLETFSFTDKSWDAAIELYSNIDENLYQYNQAWIDSFCSSAGSGMWSSVLMGVFSQGKAEWTTQHYSDLAMVLSHCENVYSADVPTALKEMTLKIQDSGKAEEFMSLTAKEAVDWLKTEDSGEAGKEFTSFLKRHGHRCVKESEFLEKSWRTEPHKVTSVLQTMLANSAKVTSHKTEVISSAEALAKVKTPLTTVGRLAMRWLVPKTRREVGKREWGKSLAVQVADVFKQGYWKLADMMVLEGRLPKEELMFFLTHREIGQLLHSRSGRLVARAQRRMKIFPRQLALQFPRIIRGHPEPLEENGAEDEFVITSLKLEGMPVSHGVARGKARVVKTLQDAASIQVGEVLIVPFTDVGWSPYFPLISGLVTEIGGLVSHGAVVAREYGIPCVVKVQKATALFKTGDNVVLNGTKGTLEKVEDCDDDDGI